MDNRGSDREVGTGMAQPVIVTGAAEPDTESAFAAGVAAATAVAAAEEAEEAASAADVAVAVASAASETAWDARAEVESLRDELRASEARIMTAIGDLVDDLNDLEEDVEDNNAPEAITPEPEPDDKKDDDKTKKTPKPKGFGANWWFGSRQ